MVETVELRLNRIMAVGLNGPMAMLMSAEMLLVPAAVATAAAFLLIVAMALLSLMAVMEAPDDLYAILASTVPLGEIAVASPAVSPLITASVLLSMLLLMTAMSSGNAMLVFRQTPTLLTVLS